MKRNKLALLAGAATAVLAAGATGTATGSQAALSVENHQPANTPKQKEKLMAIPIYLGGVPVLTEYFNRGRSPKYYGMHVVRRGTHKRSNQL